MSAERPLKAGDIVTVALPRHTPAGREQHGERPAVVVAIPDLLGKPRYPMLVVVPLTTTTGSWVFQNPALYPILKAGTGGLPQNSVVLLDHIRSIDLARLRNYLGTLTSEQYRPIANGLRKMFAT